MQAADTPEVEEAIQNALADESETELRIESNHDPRDEDPPPLTVNDARRIIACLENPRFDTLFIYNYDIHNPAVLNVFRVGLPLCTTVTTVKLQYAILSNEDLDRLRPAFYNTSVTSLDIHNNDIQGHRGGEVLRDLLIGNNSLVEFDISYNPIGPEGVHGPGRGLAGNNHLQKLNLQSCNIGNGGLANLLLSMGEAINYSLTELYLTRNNIQSTEGGRQVSLLLQRFPSLKVMFLNYNNLGPLGARALAPGLASAACHLESLELFYCGLGNDGVVNLVPDGQVNRSLAHLEISGNNIQGLVGGENVVALVSRCTNLDSISVHGNSLSTDQQHRLDLLLDRKRLCTEASALGGSPFSVLFRAVEKAHRHEHGLSAIFVILQNDGDDYFCTANNRAVSGSMDIVQSVTGGKRKR